MGKKMYKNGDKVLIKFVDEENDYFELIGTLTDVHPWVGAGKGDFGVDVNHWISLKMYKGFKINIYKGDIVKKVQGITH